MTPEQYLLGLCLLVVVVGSLGFTAWRVRRFALPGWSGAPARLAELVIGVATLILLGEVLGAGGAFARWPLVGVCVVLAGAALWIQPRRAELAPSPEAQAAAPLAVVLAAGTTGLVLVAWGTRVADAYRDGMGEYDTLWYHMPFAARFANDGWVTGLHNVGNPATSFFPASSELVHAVGLLLFDGDLLSPLVNLAWFGLALLAGWCIGRPAGVAPATATAVLVVLALPVMVDSQAGSAKNDVAGLALVLAAVAFAMTAPRTPSARLLAVLSLGLAVGIKVSFIAPALALAVALVVLQRRGERMRMVGLAAGGLVIGGGFWYVRNAVYIHNPFPWFDLGFLGLSLPSTPPPIDCGTTSLADYVTNGGVLRQDIYPFLSVAFGGRWPLILALAAAGVIGALVRPRRLQIVLAGVAVATAAAYVLTPATAGGEHARCFYYNTRVAAPALALGVVLIPLVLARAGSVARMAITAAIAAVVASSIPYPVPVAGYALAAAAAISAAFVAYRKPRFRTGVLAAGLAGSVVAVGVAGWLIQDDYVTGRYAAGKLPDRIGASYLALRDFEHRRIAVGGFFAHYPLYGIDSSNDVELPADLRAGIFRPVRNCREWQEALRRGHYDFVVTAPSDGGPEPAEARWTRFDPDAVQILHVGDNRVFRFDANLSSSAAPGCT